MNPEMDPAMDPAMSGEQEPPLGWVPVEGRGSLPFALVHGEALVATASWALEEAGVQLVDQGTDPERVRRSGRPLVLHDPLCPMTPPAFLRAAIELSARSGTVVVGHRPVTDTVKPLSGDLDGGLLGETVDRAGLIGVTSPVVIPGAVLAQLDRLRTDDFAGLVDDLAQRFGVRLLEAPAAGRRARDEADLAVLEALTRER
jgi:2-C-methyl-D-erythritol 4-phosphate cytidylyltransferase